MAIAECHLCGARCFLLLLLLLFFLFLSSSSSSSRCGRDLCKAPSAWLGLFLSLAALPLTFLAVPPASALLANPFYRELNIAQAARKICSAGHVGLGSASAASAGAGSVRGLGGGSAHPAFLFSVPINGEHRGTACFDGCHGVSHLSLSQHHHFCPARCLLGYTHQHWGILGWGVAGVCHQPCSCQQNHSTKPQIAAVLRKNPMWLRGCMWVLCKTHGAGSEAKLCGTHGLAAVLCHGKKMWGCCGACRGVDVGWSSPSAPLCVGAAWFLPLLPASCFHRSHGLVKKTLI